MDGMAELRFARGPMTIEGQVRALVVHEASGYEEWGANGAIRVAPSASGRGLTLSIAPVWGNAGSASERLWSARNAGELGAGQEFEATARLETELGYGIVVPGSPCMTNLAAGDTSVGSTPWRGVGELAPRGDPPAARDRVRALADGPERPGASCARRRGRLRTGRGVGPLAAASCRRRGPRGRVRGCAGGYRPPGWGCDLVARAILVRRIRVFPSIPGNFRGSRRSRYLARGSPLFGTASIRPRRPPAHRLQQPNQSVSQRPRKRELPPFELSETDAEDCREISAQGLGGMLVVKSAQRCSVAHPDPATAATGTVVMATTRHPPIRPTLRSAEFEICVRRVGDAPVLSLNRGLPRPSCPLRALRALVRDFLPVRVPIIDHERSQLRGRNRSRGS